REAVVRGDDLRRDLCVVAGHGLLAEGEVRRVEEEEALRVGPHEEFVEQPLKLRYLFGAPIRQVLVRGAIRQRLRIEELPQERTQRGELLFSVAFPAD